MAPKTDTQLTRSFCVLEMSKPPPLTEAIFQELTHIKKNREESWIKNRRQIFRLNVAYTEKNQIYCF
jgi:hypothetical protein